MVAVQTPLKKSKTSEEVFDWHLSLN